MEIRHHTVHANGIRQHYLDAGQGPPVVLLHGFPETNYAWRHQIPALATRYRVIAPDLRGYGENGQASFWLRQENHGARPRRTAQKTGNWQDCAGWTRSRRARRDAVRETSSSI